MSQLHEVLAVEQDLQNTATTLTKETQKNLGREHLFKGHVKTHELLREDDRDTPQQSPEEVPVDSTVMEMLDYLVKPVSKYYDAVLQKESTNQTAKADLVVGGEVLAKDVPATFLLGLENKLKQLYTVFNNIPTLEAGKNWIEDASNQKAGVFKTSTIEERFQTKNETDWRVIAEATDRHPAQVKELSKTVNVGKYLTTHFSGMMKPVDKAAILERLNELIRATKKARMRANTAEVVKAEIGEVIFSYLLGK